MEKDTVAAKNRLDSLRGKSATVQIDVTDGQFCEGKSFPLEDLVGYEYASEFVWEVHLLVKEPIKWLAKCQEIGALRVIGQIEIMSDPVAFLEAAHEMGFEAGLAFDTKTPLVDIPIDCDDVLLMSRKAGFMDAEFDEIVFDKIKLAKQLQEEMGIPFRIGVDGGISPDKLVKLEEAGIDAAYMGRGYELGKN